MSVETFTGDVKSADYQMWLSGLVAKRAATKRHRLGRDMVNGTRPLTQAAYDGIMRNLDRCDDLLVVASVKEEPVAQPAPQVPQLTFQDIPAGFYATESATGNNDFDYWKVLVSKKGFRSAKRVVGGGTTQQPKLIEITKGQQISALRAIIKAGINEAKALYAEKEERCTECGRQLTDKTSQARGMGNDCWEQYGL